VSFTKRLIDLARSNLNALLEKAADSTDPRRKLASIPDAELEAELERRKTARRVGHVLLDAKARVEGKVAPDRAERERLAKEREARVRAERAARAAREQSSRPSSSSGGSAGSTPPPRSSSSSSSSGPRPGASSGSSGPRRPPPASSRDPQINAYYERLEVPIGSDWETVKAAYRRLMRKYHPDLHGHKSPEKLKAATEVSQALTQAYNELEKVLVPKGPR
jgi:DnaJ-domain-containing protein 1